jgi:hypothetical protein
MTAAAASIGIPDHVIPDLGHQLPFHSLARLIRRSGHFLKRLVEREVVADRILRPQVRLGVSYKVG